MLYVDWVCWFSTPSWEVFPRVLRFSPLIKKPTFDLIWIDLIWFVNNTCKILIRAMLIWFPLELLSAFGHIHMQICAIEILNINIDIKIQMRRKGKSHTERKTCDLEQPENGFHESVLGKTKVLDDPVQVQHRVKWTNHSEERGKTCSWEWEGGFF